MSGPLSGIKILDLTRLLPGAFCTQILADYGAEVLKIEQPDGGDYIRWFPPMIKTQSVYSLALNRNKKSLKLNLKMEKGREILYALIPKYDVFIESFRPGVVGRMGINYERVRSINPALVYCSITGFGQDGPYKERVGHDINYIGLAGFLSIVGQKDGPPTIPGWQMADIGGGSLMATLGVLMALWVREKTGRGQYIDISMLDGVMSWLDVIAAEYFITSKVPKRGEMMLSGMVPCYRVYQTRDGKYLTIGALEEKFWGELCAKLGREDLARSQFCNGLEGERIHREMERLFKTKTLKEWVSLLEKADVCMGPVNSLDEALQDPQVVHRQMVIEVEHPTDGRLKQIGFPIKFSETKPDIRIPSPAFGQHTEEVLGELGLDKEEIEKLRKEGIV
jgi:crotonobetainyl-CoA:carnitine CoA-transferase CaiB-like acyl-CoA transferase